MKSPPWNAPTGGTPDYFNVCSPSTFVEVPENIFGNQTSHFGQAYSGIVTYCIDCNVSTIYREYIQIELSEPLIPSKKYNIEFYISLADSSIFAIEDIGMYFSQNSIQLLEDDNIEVEPQFAYEGSFLTNKNGWDLIEGSYTANGDEKYIII